MAQSTLLASTMWLQGEHKLQIVQHYFCFVYRCAIPTMKVVEQSHSITHPFFCCHGGTRACIRATLTNLVSVATLEYQLETRSGIKCDKILNVITENRQANKTRVIEFRIEKVSSSFDNQPFVLFITETGSRKKKRTVTLEPIMVRSKPHRAVLAKLSTERKQHTVSMRNKRLTTKRKREDLSDQDPDNKRRNVRLTEALSIMACMVREHRAAIQKMHATNKYLQLQLDELKREKEESSTMAQLYSWDEIVVPNTMMNTIQ